MEEVDGEHADGLGAQELPPAQKRPLAEPADLSADFDEGWVCIGDQRMFVVGYVSGGAPYGWIDNSIGGVEDRLR